MAKERKNKLSAGRLSLKVYEPLIDYFEHNDMGSKLSEKEIMEAEVNISKRSFVMNVKSNTAKSLLQIAQHEGMTTTTLLQKWLKEKVSEYVSRTSI